MEIRDSKDTVNRLIELINNLKKIREIKGKSKNVIKLKKVDFATPLSILPLSVFSNLNNVTIDFSKIKSDVKSYLEHINFPEGSDCFDIEDKKYIPICKLKLSSRDELSNIENKLLENIFDKVDDESDRNVLVNAIKLLISELYDNIDQHANISDYWIQAQFYDKSKVCEICLIDTGIGIRKSYEKNKIFIKLDSLAIYAAMNGTSSKKEEGRGTGIPSVVRIFIEKYKGELVIVSGNGAIYKKHNKETLYQLPINWQGTIVCIRFKIRSNLENIYSALQ